MNNAQRQNEREFLKPTMVATYDHCWNNNHCTTEIQGPPILLRPMSKILFSIFFISGNIPFNQADNPEFKKLMQLIKIHGKRVMINRKVIRAQLTANAAMACTDLKKQLATNISRVSLAMDGWTSRLNNSYLGIPNPFIL